MNRPTACPGTIDCSFKSRVSLMHTREDRDPMTEDADELSKAPHLDPMGRVSIRRLERMTSMSREELDELPIGAIKLDAEGNVLAYNAAEARLAGLDAKDVIGKDFFTDIAPCTNVQEFAGRFRTELEPGRPPIVFPYQFSFSRKRVHVTLQCPGLVSPGGLQAASNAVEVVDRP